MKRLVLLLTSVLTFVGCDYFRPLDGPGMERTDDGLDSIAVANARRAVESFETKQYRMVEYYGNKALAEKRLYEHNPPVLGGGDHQGAFLNVKSNAPIGLWPDLKYEGEQLDDVKGRALFVYSDGLNEAENEQKVQLGEQKLIDILRSTDYESSRQIIERMEREVEHHRNGAEPNDDLTMMCIHVK